MISWEGVEIDDYAGTALLRSVSATRVRKRQKARAQTLTLCHNISTKSAELLGALLNADGMQERKLFLPPVFAPNKMALSGHIFNPKLYRKPRGGTPWSMKCCIAVYLNYHANSTLFHLSCLQTHFQMSLGGGTSS